VDSDRNYKNAQTKLRPYTGFISANRSPNTWRFFGFCDDLRYHRNIFSDREDDYVKQRIREGFVRENKGYYFNLHYTMKVTKEGQSEFMSKSFYLFYDNEYLTQVFRSSAGFHNDIAIQIVPDRSVSDATRQHLVEVTIDKKTFYYLCYDNIFILNACGLCGGGGHSLQTDTEYTADVRLLLWSGRYSEPCKITFRTGVDYLGKMENDSWEKHKEQINAFSSIYTG
jgi:hypothetical protein